MIFGIMFLADPGQARGCSTNSLMIKSFIKDTVTQKSFIHFYDKNGIYNADKLKFYMYFQYIQEKL